VLGAGIGQARLTSSLLGLMSVFIVYRLGCVWFSESRGPLLGACVYAFSRAFAFPATTARPDMAATTFGLLAVWWVVKHGREPRRRSAAASGVMAGLSLLAHPFGIVPATQAGVAILGQRTPIRRRLVDAVVYSAAALAVFSLWLPLIALHPDVFRVQFGHNVTGRAGPGLAATLVAPLPIVAHQARQIWEYLGPIQAGLYAAGYAWAVVRARSWPGHWSFLYHLAASLLLLVVFEGRHPTLGYYSFPAALASVAVGMLASEAAGRLERLGRTRSWRRPAIATAVVFVVLLAAFVPGSGLGALRAQLVHWRDRAYDPRAMSRTLMDDIPAGRLTAVDRPYVLDFYLAGRPVVAAAVYPTFFDVRGQPFEYAVFGRPGLKQHRAQMTDLALIKTYGNAADLFAPYAELYRRNRPDRGADR
jgi:hypothetical protein